MPETVADILAAATREFGEKGFAGARIDEIAAATRTSKRMIYYHFGSKEALYLAVLETSYLRMRQTEAALQLHNLAPELALRTLVGYTFDHHQSNQHYIRIVMSENIERGQFIRRSTSLAAQNLPAIAAVRELYERGVAEGAFRAGLDPLDIHASISALAFFNVSNQYTFGTIFGCEMQSPTYLATRREAVIDMIVRYLKP